LKSGGGTNFSIDWGDNTVVSGVTTTSHSHTYGSGTFILAINSKDDSGPIDQFQITGSQTNKNAVKKILNWGTTPWLNLTSAFQNCHGLTHIDKSDFSSGATINLTSAFQNCDNLTTVDFTGCILLASIGISAFSNCSSLRTVNFTGCNKLQSIGGGAFANCYQLRTITMPSVNKWSLIIQNTGVAWAVTFNGPPSYTPYHTSNYGLTRNKK